MSIPSNIANHTEIAVSVKIFVIRYLFSEWFSPTPPDLALALFPAVSNQVLL